ncbi:MAG: tRNA lysidine(34) synthetase TilS [Saprospiraceae bacterium]|nr:tRNA lysidine(34) synthetase TilS [Saprospiraceae bacterium]
MLKTPRKVIQNQELFSKNDKLLVGVSGGIDSMVLCDVLYREGFNFSIADCNYALRAKDSDLDEQLILQWALERNIPCFIKHVSIHSNSNIQEEARNIRYLFFNELRAHKKFNFILTAHHADDQIETFFLNLSRGAGLKGLKAMAFQSNYILRPFLEIRKTTLYDYASEHEVPYREDFTNHASKYLRNFIRNDVLTLLNKKIPAFDELVLRSIQHLTALDQFLEIIYNEWKLENVFYKSNSTEIIKPVLDRFYFVSTALVELGFHPETILEIKNHYFTTGKLFYDKNEHELLIDRDLLIIRKRNNQQIIESNYLIEDASGQFIGLAGILKWEEERIDSAAVKFPDSQNTCIIDYEKTVYPLIYRKWQDGDVIQPLGMAGKHKKVQDVLTDLKVSLFDKELVYVLASETEILWIPGYLRSEIAKLNANSKHILRFEFIKNENL